MKRAFCLASGVLLLAGMLWAQQGLVLRYKGKTGDVHRYKSWSRMRLLGVGGGESGRTYRLEFDLESIVVQRVVNVESDGTLEMETERQSRKARMVEDGQERNLPDRPLRRVVRMTNRGKVISERTIEPLESEEKQQRPPIIEPLYAIGVLEDVFVEAVHNITFPEQAVKVGDTWSEKAEEEIAPGSKVPISLRSRLKELVRLNGHRCSVIETEVEAPLEAKQTQQTPLGQVEFHLRGQLMAWVELSFDYEKGIEVLSEDSVRMVVEVTASAPGRPSQTITYKVGVNGKSVVLD